MVAPNFDVNWETLSELDKKSLISLVGTAEFELRRGNSMAIKYIRMEAVCAVMRAIDNPDVEIQEPCRRLCSEAFQHLSVQDKMRVTAEMQKMFQNGLSAYHFRLLICDTFTGMRTEGCRKVLMRLLSSDVGVQAGKALKTYKAPAESELEEMLEKAKDSAINLMRVCDLAAHYLETQEFARNLLLDNIHKSSKDVLSLISSLELMGNLPNTILESCIPILLDYQKDYIDSGNGMLIYGSFLKLFTRYFCRSKESIPKWYYEQLSQSSDDQILFLQTCTELMNNRPKEEGRIRNETTLVRVIDSNSTARSMQWIIVDTLLALIDNSLLQDCFAFWFPFRYATVLVVNADDPDKRIRERALKLIHATSKYNDSLEFYKDVRNFKSICSGPGFIDIRDSICKRFAALPSFEDIFGGELRMAWLREDTRSNPDPVVATAYDFRI